MRKLLYQLAILQVSSLLFLGLNVNAQSFVLQGSVSGKDTGVVLLHYINSSNVLCRDTATVRQGKFTFSGSVAGADYAMLDSDTNYLYADNAYSRHLFIEPGTIHISFKYGDLGNATISGSKTQMESDALDLTKGRELDLIKLIRDSVDAIRLLLKNNSIDAQLAEKKIKELQKIAAPAWQSMTNKDVQYIQQHPESYVSLMLLTYLIGQLPEDSMDVLYANLSNEVKNSSLDYEFLKYYSRYKKAMGKAYPFDQMKMNEKAPDFTIYKTVTDSMTLDTFKGSVVLLEFWELTCLPCLEANPFLE